MSTNNQFELIQNISDEKLWDYFIDDKDIIMFLT